MLKDCKAFSGFSVSDLALAKEFYSQTLGLDTEQDEMGLTVKLIGGNNIFVYQKDDHIPATYTILNFIVKNIEQMVNDLTSRGVMFEQFDLGGGAKTDESGIMRGIAAQQGPDIAWFKDPAGNILSILQES